MSCARRRVQVAIEQLVPGDIVLLEQGDHVIGRLPAHRGVRRPRQQRYHFRGVAAAGARGGALSRERVAARQKHRAGRHVDGVGPSQGRWSWPPECRPSSARSRTSPKRPGNPCPRYARRSRTSADGSRSASHGSARPSDARVAERARSDSPVAPGPARPAPRTRRSSPR
jgi:hypothetical protein